MTTFLLNMVISIPFMEFLYHPFLFFSTLGKSRLPCTCEISWLWKDYKNIYEILPRNLLGFHFLKTPAYYGNAYEHDYPPLQCYDILIDGRYKLWDDVDLSTCIDIYTGKMRGFVSSKYGNLYSIYEFFSSVYRKNSIKLPAFV